MEALYLSYFTQNKEFPFFIQYGQHDKDMFMHTHGDFCELTIVLNGSAIHIVNEERFIVKKGDVFVIGDGLAHGYEDAHEFKICNIMFRLKDLMQEDSDIKKTVGFHALFVIEPFLSRDHKFKSRLHLSLSEYETVSKYIAEMVGEYERNAPGVKTMLHAKFMELVVLFARAYKIPDESKDNTLGMALPISYMESHFTEQISLEELASMANVSVRHFSRIFGSAYGVSPGQYIYQLRIQYARILLKEKSRTISEVAVMAGYSDSNYFTRQFKKATGVTPGQYRNILEV